MKVTSFADVADLRAYNRALDDGNTPEQALSYGDQGVGAWNKSTVAGTGPCFAYHLSGGARNNRMANITVGNKTVIAQCRDIAPYGDIDCNPDLCAALGLTPPVMADGTLEWI